MATPKAIIDTVLTLRDGVDPTLVAATENAGRRVRYLHQLQHINAYVHNFREWEWTFKEGTITVLVNTKSIALPSDFLEFSYQGGAYRTSNPIRMRERSRYRMSDERNILTGGTGNLQDAFYIFGGLFQLPFNVTSNTDFLLFYRRSAETLADGTTVMLIPDRYAQTVLIPGLTFQGQTSKNDARQTWGQQFSEGLSQMCMIENPNKTGVKKLPLSVRGAW